MNILRILILAFAFWGNFLAEVKSVEYCGGPVNDRLRGGSAAFISEFKWLAILIYENSDNSSSFRCEGALINKQFVLTAAHCVNGKDIPKGWQLNKVRLGEFDTTSDYDCEDYDDSYFTTHTDVIINQTFVHKAYDKDSVNQHNDIALIKLAHPIELKSNIIPVCLPTPDNLARNQTESWLEIAGWTQNRTKMAKFTAKYISSEVCKEFYSNKGIELDDGQLCVEPQYHGEIFCRANSGGPLMDLDDKDNHRAYYFLTGLASFGASQCGGKGMPEVYTKVEKFMPWIEENMKIV